MPDANPKKHLYDANATVLSGQLKHPVAQKIEPQAHSELDPEGGYFSQRSDGYTLESVLSFRRAYSHVAGHRDNDPSRPEKRNNGWTTLTTTVIEGLNVLEVLTADRVVGQTITEHPIDGFVPTISFLGTRFENLCICGHKVHLEYDTGIFGPKPLNDMPYILEAGFMGRVRRQYNGIIQDKNLPAALQQKYNQLSSKLDASQEVECSLITKAVGLFPGSSFGNVITIPDFGTITLGKVIVKHENPHEKTKVPQQTTFTLTMIDLNLGCAINGNIPVGTGTSNGGPVGMTPPTPPTP
jgi:hypothetical protein